MRYVIVLIGIVGIVLVTGVIAACIMAAEEDCRMEKHKRYDESCDYHNCTGDCDSCDKY